MAGNKKIELNSAWSFNLYWPKRQGQKVERWTFFPVSFRSFRRKAGGLYRGCHRPFMHRSWLRLLTEDVSANTEASCARMKKKQKKLCYQGTKVAKRWAFTIQQTLFQQYHANENEMDISVSLYTPMHSVQTRSIHVSSQTHFPRNATQRVESVVTIFWNHHKLQHRGSNVIRT